MKDGHLYGSLVDILRNSAPTVILAIGMTLVIATGGVDLSVGAVMAITASVACILIDPRIVGVNLQGNITAVVGDPTYSFVPMPVVIVVPLFVGHPVRRLERHARLRTSGSSPWWRRWS